MTSSAVCQGCGKELNPVEALHWDICFNCTKARHRSVNGRCKCGRMARPTKVLRIGSRSWIACHRCLGQIRQLS